MDLRLRNSSELDTRAVRLPQGTEIITRVDRVGDAAALVERERAGERVGLDATTRASWRPRVDTLFARLDSARESSPLPEAPPNEPEIRAWLVGVRRARF